MVSAAKRKPETRLQKMLDDLMMNLGATRGPNYLGHNWILNTKAGKLEVACWPDSDSAIFCRFEDVERAKKYIAHNYEDQLNPYTGKWNFNLFPEMPENLIRWFQIELKRIL